jgi:hypothetical protein
MYDIQNPLSKLDYRQNPQLMPAPKPLPSAKIHKHLHPRSHPLHSAPVSKASPLSPLWCLVRPLHVVVSARISRLYLLVQASIGSLEPFHYLTFSSRVRPVGMLFLMQRPEADAVADILTEVLEPRAFAQFTSVTRLIAKPALS